MIPINSVSSYTISCAINGTPVSFLIPVDAGAGVCLLRNEVWKQVKSDSSILKPITAHWLLLSGECGFGPVHCATSTCQ